MEQRKEKSKSNPKKSLQGVFKLFFETHFSQKEFFRSKITLWLLALNIVSNAANWIAIAVFINRLDGDIILHYNVYFGVDSLGNWRQVFILPIIGLVILALNAVLAAYFYIRKERIASYILLLTAFMVQLSLIVAALSVIMINY